MRHFGPVLLSGAFLAFSEPAFAGEHVTVSPEPLPPMQQMSKNDWSGRYFGLSVSTLGSNGDARRTLATGAIVETDVSNGLFPYSIGDWQTASFASASIGYNLQRNDVVYGFELNVSGMEEQVAFQFARVDPEILVGVNTISRFETEIGNLSTLSIRGGYTVDGLLFFVKTGITYANIRNQYELDLSGGGIPVLTFNQEKPRWGYAVGVGVERRLSENVSLLGELTYFDFSNVTVEARAPAIFPGNALDYTFQNDGFIAKIGLNISF